MKLNIEWFKYFFSEPAIIVIFIFGILGCVGGLIGKCRQQPISAAFLLGLMLGPIGWLIIFFLKTPQTQAKELEKLVNFLSGDGNLTLQERIRYKKLLKRYMTIIYFGRILVFLTLPGAIYISSMMSHKNPDVNFIHVVKYVSPLYFLFIVSFGLIQFSLSRLIKIVNTVKYEFGEDSFLGWTLMSDLFLMRKISEVLKKGEDFLKKLNVS